jgi:isochorismate synthase EntC
MIKKSGIKYKEYAENHTHNPSIGCISDFTNNKRDVILKLRTGDLCDSCLLLFKAIPPKEIKGYSMMLEEIRSKTLFIRRALRLYEHSKIIIKKENNHDYPKRNIWFEQYDQSLVLAPDAHALYLFLLNNEEGLRVKKDEMIDTKGSVIKELAEYLAELQNDNIQSEKTREERIKIATKEVRKWFESDNVKQKFEQVFNRQVKKKLEKVVLDKKIRQDYDVIYDSETLSYKIKLARKKYLIWN